jgi:hypothetical protein
MSIERSPKPWQPLLLSFALFATLVSAADLWLTFVGPKSLKADLIAYTGWLPSGPYLFSAFWAWMLLATGDRRRLMRLMLVVQMLVGVVAGYYSYRLRGEDFGNPYLMVSRWQTVWTMAVPAAWAALLMLPGRRTVEG